MRATHGPDGVHYRIPAGPAPFAPLPYPVAGPALSHAAEAAATAAGNALEQLRVHVPEERAAAAHALDQLAEEAAVLGQALQDAATADVTGLAGVVRDGASELQDALQGVVEGAAPELLADLEAAERTAAGGSQTVDRMLALAAPLNWGRAAVEHIGELLEAMALGL